MQSPLAMCFHADILLSLFEPEYGSDMFLQTSVDFSNNCHILSSCLLCNNVKIIICKFGSPPAFTLVSCSAYLTLKMEEICSSDMSVDFQRTTQRYIPQINSLDTLCDWTVSWINLNITWGCTFQNQVDYHKIPLSKILRFVPIWGLLGAEQQIKICSLSKGYLIYELV
jgi:hypothetical protein